MNVPADNTIHVRISSMAAHLRIVRGMIEKACDMVGFDAETTGNVVLSVDEALTNIIKHAYGGAEDKPIEIDLTSICESGNQGLRIQLRDFGRQVDPSKIKSRDLSDVRPGGLGVHIMTECMDTVQFTPAEGGGTQLTLTKMTRKLPSRQETTP